MNVNTRIYTRVLMLIINVARLSVIISALIEEDYVYIQFSAMEGHLNQKSDPMLTDLGLANLNLFSSSQSWKHITVYHYDMWL